MGLSNQSKKIVTGEEVTRGHPTASLVFPDFSDVTIGIRL